MAWVGRLRVAFRPTPTAHSFWYPMYEPLTLVHPDTPSADSDRVSSGLPPDLLKQVRGRLRLLAGFFVVAFGMDLVIFALSAAYIRITGRPIPGIELRLTLVNWLGMGAICISAGLWWAAHSPRLSPTRLLSIGLAYQIAMCLIIAVATFWGYYHDRRILPNLTWVPAVVIMFPLILPGPPRRMFAAALAAAAMSPFGLWVLDLAGEVTADGQAYFEAAFSPLVAAGFAYFGARIIYGLGRQVARARELGSYRLGELLGRGGMGEVYRATHRMLARPAAIKLIRPEMIGPADGGADLAIRRFRREAEVAASLRSPHTVELYDFGVAEGNTFYFVMELLEGMDLESLVRSKGPLPPNRTVHILCQVCESLEEAHAAGLVHRDIKPANIHIGRLGVRHDFVKVLDFGLVKSVENVGSEQSLATAAGFTPGTPAYMAPEMALGEAFDGRADLYAVGCVAYYLLTGHLVFDAGNGLQMIAKHIRDVPLPPSKRSELPVPPALDRLVLSCLEKKPENRPADAATLSRSLAMIEGDPWREEQARQWWTTNRSV